MKKYKICVYAICKNEEKFVKRFVESVKDADGIYVLDTGSTDNSVSLLMESGVFVKQEIINPFRFDVARNKSLELVPEDCDICICMDLDEVILPGWREKLESIWTENMTRLSYPFNWSLDEFGKPLISFYSEKIHSRHDYKWTHPVHEILTFVGENHEIRLTTNDITINHYPDPTKSRGSYLSLLELSVEEDPEDDRNMHYLGREYMYYKKYGEAIKTFHKHLNLKRATWIDERCASMRFMGRCYYQLGFVEEAKMWFEKAIKEAPHLRDPLVERAMISYDEKNYKEVIYYLEKALEIKEHQKTYINEVFSWNQTPYDLLSIAYYYEKNYTKAKEACKKAIELNPKDERLKNNLSFIEKEA